MGFREDERIMWGRRASSCAFRTRSFQALSGLNVSLRTSSHVESYSYTFLWHRGLLQKRKDPPPFDEHLYPEHLTAPKKIQERIDSFKAAITARNAPEARALMPDVEKLGYTITTGQAEIILEVLANDIDGTMDFLRELKRLTKPPTLHPDATRLNKILTACFERHDPITAKTIFHLMWDLGVKPTNKSVNIFENSLRELYRNPPFGENTTRIMFSQPDPAEMKILAEKYKKNKKPRQFS